MQPDIGGQLPSPELIIKPLCWRVRNVFPSSSAHGTGLAQGRFSSRRVWTSKGPWPREGQCDLANSGLTSGSDSAARVLLLAVFPGAPRKGPGRPRVPDAAGRESASTPRATRGRTRPPPSPRSWLCSLSVEGQLLASGSHEEAPGRGEARRHPRTHLPPVHAGRRAVHTATPPQSGLRCAHTPRPGGSVAAPAGCRGQGAEGGDCPGALSSRRRRSRLRTPGPSAPGWLSLPPTQRRARGNVSPPRTQPKRPSTEEAINKACVSTQRRFIVQPHTARRL